MAGAVLAGAAMVLTVGGFNAFAYDYSGQEDRVTEARARPTSNKVPPTAIEALKALVPSLHVKSGSAFFKGATYVGWKTCNSCHAEQVKEWKKTWHAKMEQWPTKDTVIGEFDGKLVTYNDVEVTSRDGKVKAKVTFQVKPFRRNGSYYFTVLDKDNAANDQTFKIEKTLGGKWDQGYEILIGKNYYPAILRYSNTGGGWLVKSFKPALWIEPDGTPDGRPRRADELPLHRVAEAKCAGCHTTGFEYKKDDKGVAQAVGNGQLGVGCEKCHGPASLHIKAAEQAKAAGKTLEPGRMKIVHGLKDLDFQQQNQLCAQCHGRATNRQDKTFAFPHGFRPGDMNIIEKLVFWNYQSTRSAKKTKYFFPNNWAKRNRQQWQDHQLSTHYTKAGHSCLTCHTVHGKWKNMQLRQEPQAMCTSCHTAKKHVARPQTEMFAGSKMEDAGVLCINCHMARIGFRSHVTKKSAKGMPPMDGSAHTFLVPTPAIKKAFGVRTACEVCHDKDRQMPPHVNEWINQHPMSDDELDARLKRIQTGVRAQVSKVQEKMPDVVPRTAEKRALVESARANLNFVLLDGSMGFHNPEKAKKKLDDALAMLDRATAIRLVSRQDKGATGGTGTTLADKGTITDKSPITIAKSAAPATAPPGSNPAAADVVTGSIEPGAGASGTGAQKEAAITAIPLLTYGANGKAVHWMQCLLDAAGYAITIDNDFGPETQTVLEKFQEAEGLNVDGLAGPETLKALRDVTSGLDLSGCTPTLVVKKAGLNVLPNVIRRLLKFGDMGDDVRALQSLLKTKGYAISPDSHYGDLTRRIVMRFQENAGIDADGKVGERTMTALQGA